MKMTFHPPSVDRCVAILDVDVDVDTTATVGVTLETPLPRTLALL
jgi:hypothetical protein